MSTWGPFNYQEEQSQDCFLFCLLCADLFTGGMTRAEKTNTTLLLFEHHYQTLSMTCLLLDKTPALQLSSMLNDQYFNKIMKAIPKTVSTNNNNRLQAVSWWWTVNTTAQLHRKRSLLLRLCDFFFFKMIPVWVPKAKTGLANINQVKLSDHLCSIDFAMEVVVWKGYSCAK